MFDVLCPNGHCMSYLTYDELVSINPDYNSGCWCDVCQDKIVPQCCCGARERIYHCSESNYDMCQSCADGGTYKTPVRIFPPFPQHPPGPIYF
jgi:hypothetical protein